MSMKFVNVLETSKLRIRLHYLDSVSYVLLNFKTLRLFKNLAPGAYVTESVSSGHFLLGSVCFRTALPCFGDYHLEMGGMTLTDAVGVN